MKKTRIRSWNFNHFMPLLWMVLNKFESVFTLRWYVVSFTYVLVPCKASC